MECVVVRCEIERVKLWIHMQRDVRSVFHVTVRKVCGTKNKTETEEPREIGRSGCTIIS